MNTDELRLYLRAAREHLDIVGDRQENEVAISLANGVHPSMVPGTDETRLYKAVRALFNAVEMMAFEEHEVESR